ncbi:MAG: GNAT family N-acetyltransferase [Candidatus Geothermincolia bacterium]
MSDWVIRSIPQDDYLEESARVIRASFAGVATYFELTEKNCPTNPAFETATGLRQARKKGTRLFGMFEGSRQTGFVAVEKADADTWYMERLGVLPGHRHEGRGKALVDFVLDFVRDRGGKLVSIGAIAENMTLLEWYKSLGFVERETKEVEHLPFLVTFLDITID